MQRDFLRALTVILATLLPSSAFPYCTLTETRCTYTCTEYYPNGTDCRKTKKECEEVCIQFEVKKSHQEHVPQTEESAAKKGSQEK